MNYHIKGAYSYKRKLKRRKMSIEINAYASIVSMHMDGVDFMSECVMEESLQRFTLC